MEGEFVFVIFLDIKDVEQIVEFLEQLVKDFCEGLMVKILDVDVIYEIVKRLYNWFKLKKDYFDGVGDILDLVVIGVYLGWGKWVGWYGGFLLVFYDEDSEELQVICKFGIGFSDEELEEYYQSFKVLVLFSFCFYVWIDGVVIFDYWLDFSVVWEVKCVDFFFFFIYFVVWGLVDSDKGIFFCFFWFIWVCEDKQLEQVIISVQVVCLYWK